MNKNYIIASIYSIIVIILIILVIYFAIPKNSVSIPDTVELVKTVKVPKNIPQQVAYDQYNIKYIYPVNSEIARTTTDLYIKQEANNMLKQTEEQRRITMQTGMYMGIKAGRTAAKQLQQQYPDSLIGVRQVVYEEDPAKINYPKVIVPDYPNVINIIKK
jgi:hypothetical protein